MSLSLGDLSVLYSQHIPVEFSIYMTNGCGDCFNSLYRFLAHPRHIKTIEELFVEQDDIWVPKKHNSKAKDKKYSAFTAELFQDENKNKDSVPHAINGKAAIRTTEMACTIYEYYQFGFQHDTPEHAGREEYVIIPSYEERTIDYQEKLLKKHHYNMGDMTRMVDYDVKTGEIEWSHDFQNEKPNPRQKILTAT